MSGNEATSLQHCENCGASLSGEFCASCGQSVYGPNRFFLTLVHEAFENIFQFDSRALRTLGQILLIPGKVAEQYLAGKRKSYVHPMRLYIVTSILYFLFLSISNFLAPSVGGNIIQLDADTAIEEVQKQIEQAQNQAGGDSTEAKSESTIALEQLQRTIAKAREEYEAEKETEKKDKAAFGSDNLDLNIPGVSEERENRWEQFIRDQLKTAETTLKEDPRELVDQFLEVAPVLMFLTLPLVALLLKLIFLFHRFYYTEHLVFVVYNHCFLFLLLLTIQLVDFVAFAGLIEPVQELMSIWIILYLFFSLKRVYGLSFPKTLLAAFPLVIGHAAILGMAAMMVIFVGLITL